MILAALSVLLAFGGAAAMPSAEAAAAPAVTLRFLMIVKPVSQVSGLAATLSQALVDAARTASSTRFPGWSRTSPPARSTCTLLQRHARLRGVRSRALIHP